MSDPQPNPYLPPGARVADPPTDPARFDGTLRPRVVLIALWLLWATIAIELIHKGLIVNDALRMGTTSVIASNSTIALVGVVCWMIVMIGRRRNWARVTYAILFALGTIGQVVNWQNLLNGPVRDLWIIVPQCGLQLVAMILLFRREANAWFGSRKAPDPAA
jgi:hypothetical protein